MRLLAIFSTLLFAFLPLSAVAQDHQEDGDECSCRSDSVVTPPGGDDTPGRECTTTGNDRRA